MSSQSFDSEQFKNNRVQAWDSAAPAWQHWSEVWDVATQHISERLIELAGIEAGQHVLDIATGLGEPAVSAARRVGSAGHVVATDFSPAMLELAGERAAAMGIKNIEFRQVDAEQLDFQGERFDAVLSRWGVPEFPEVSVALRKIHQHLLPGGRLAIAVWAPPPEVPFLAVPSGIVRQLFDVPAPAPGTPSPFSLGDRTKLEDELTQAGFVDVRLENQIVTMEFPSLESYRGYLEDASPIVREVLVKQPAEKQAKAWLTIARSMQKFARADGTLKIPNGTICAAGKR